MIKEITQIVEDRTSFTGVITKKSDYDITMQMKVIEADEFVDDDYDEEIRLTTKIVEACEESGNVNILPLRRSIPAEFSKSAHYTDIVEVAELLAETSLFQSTRRFRPNYLLISSDLLPVLLFHREFTIEPCIKINGIYVAGKYKNLPVLVSPTLDRGQMIWGVNETNASAIYTFINKEGKVCNKIASPDHLTMIKLED